MQLFGGELLETGNLTALWINFGLGQRMKIESPEITWPSGQVDRLTNVPINQNIAVKEGTEIVPRDFPKVTIR